jgi:hypothetical protein
MGSNEAVLGEENKKKECVGEWVRLTHQCGTRGNADAKRSLYSPESSPYFKQRGQSKGISMGVIS